MKNNIEHLYIHIPFCSSKCDYCAFHSIPSPVSGQIEKYFHRLEVEINNKKKLTSKLKSIYIGGGTPSLLSAKQLNKLISLIKNNFIISKSAEITIECNPDSLTPNKINIISSFANRISIGVQSFNENHIKLLGRKGNLKNLSQHIDLFKQNNIHNLSFDFIYAIPGQTIKDFKDDLHKALSFPIKHISLYSLTFEEGTYLTEKLPHTEKEFEELSASMWKEAEKILLNNNLHRYEVSNYSIKAYECKHNLNTWFGGNLLGIGPKASSFDGDTRWTNQETENWLVDEKPEIDDIPTNERIVEIFSMGLRTNIPWHLEKNSISHKLYSEKSKYFIIINKNFTEKLISQLTELNKIDFVNISSNNNLTTISSTKKGMLFWDSIALSLMEIT